MALRIACDLDGTLADMDAALQREAEQLFGADVLLHARGTNVEMPPVDGNENEVATAGVEGSPAPAAAGLSARQFRQLWAHVRAIENFWTSLAEIEPGAVTRLAELAARHAWELIFFTQRPATSGETSQLQTQRWLESHGFELPSVFVIGGARGRAAAALRLHAVLDDRPENCLDVASESKALLLLIWRGEPETVPPGASRLGIETMFSIASAFERLERLMVERTRPRTLTSRVREAMGF